MNKSKCPVCGSTHTVKYGVRNGVQTYKCANCGYRFRNSKLPSDLELWRLYQENKQTVAELAESLGTSASTIKRRLQNIVIEWGKPAIDDWIEETISGAKAYNKRILGRLLRRVHRNDIIICTELSRLGRNLFMIMDILNICMHKECRVWTIKDHYRLGDDIQSKVLAFAFGLSAEIERNLISLRTKEALARKKSEGVTLGRPVGAHTAPNHRKLYPYRRQLFALYAKGHSIAELARRYHVARSTIFHYLHEQYPNKPTTP